MNQNRHLPRAIPRLRLASTLRVLALLGLFLLPIQLRAGTAFLHPHALLHLLLDASDGAIDHHTIRATTPADHTAGDHRTHVRRDDGASPDLPTFASIQMGAGGLAVILVLLVQLTLVAARDRVWPREGEWLGLRILPERPPPRLSAA